MALKMIQTKPKSMWLNRLYCRSTLPNLVKIGQVNWSLLFGDGWTLIEHWSIDEFSLEYYRLLGWRVLESVRQIAALNKDLPTA
jgi:hypothetical protein